MYMCICAYVGRCTRLKMGIEQDRWTKKVYRFKLNQAHSRGERQEKRGVGGKLYALYCLGNAAVLNGFGVV